MVSFEQQLRRVCTNCKPTSIKTYLANVRTLAKVAGLDTVPTNKRWLGAALLKRVKAMPLQQYKRFSMAAVKALQAYGAKDDKWDTAMRDSTEKYSRIRDSGVRTQREKKNWPTGGYAALSKLAKELYEEVAHLEKKKTLSAADLYNYQRYFIILFYSKHALRGDLADVRIKKPLGPNYLKGNELHIGEHKTARARGAINLKLAEPVVQALKNFLPMVRSRTSHGYLLSTLRTGNRLRREDMLKILRNTTFERLGKKLGVQLIRVLKTTESKAEIDRAHALQQELGHSAVMQRKYISRN